MPSSAAYAGVVEIALFDQAGELARALVPAELGEVRIRAHRRGVKLWFGPAKPTRFHYEAQLIPNRLAPEGDAGSPGPDDVTIEVGFHAEHGDQKTNAAVIASLVKREKSWRKTLGPQAEAGLFLGNDRWGRVSETWIEPDLDDPDLAFELASRLADYVQAIEPLLET